MKQSDSLPEGLAYSHGTADFDSFPGHSRAQPATLQEEVAIAESCQLEVKITPAGGFSKHKSGHETKTAQAWYIRR
jgi:hypothetical protein